jgi:hypothetical protein
MPGNGNGSKNGNGDSSMLMAYAKPFAAMVVGGAALGMVVSPGESFVDLATSMDGALGAAVGGMGALYAAGAAQFSSDNQQYAMIAGTVAVPGLVGGEFDMQLGAIAAGALGAAYLLTQSGY